LTPLAGDRSIEVISFGPEARDGALSWISCDITGVTGGYAARPLRIKSRRCGPLCAKSCRSRNVRVGCAPCKGGAFQWVQIPSGNRSNRKQSEQSWR